MAEKHKDSNYVKIVNDIVPELKCATNPIEIGSSKEFQTLKNVILLGNT